MSAVVFLPDGKRCVSVGGDKTLRVWDVDSGKEVVKLTSKTFSTGRAAVSPNGQYVVSGGGRIYDRRKSDFVVDKDYALAVWRLPEEVWPRGLETASRE